MKKVSLVGHYKNQQKNNLFNKSSKDNRDNVFQKYIELKKEFYKFGYSIATSDVHDIKSSDIVLYFSLPEKLPNKSEANKSFLLIEENNIVKPKDYMKSNHFFFKKIFTFNDDLVDNVKYFKFNHAHLFPEKINKELSRKTKLCTLIAANKKLSHPLALNDERVDVIRWFERNHPEDFDLYGIGWDRYIFSGPRIIRALNRVPFFQKKFAVMSGNKYPSYRGPVPNKKIILEKYKFSICYENTKDVPGYISEKIFDSFFAGCVPIYWGASNVLDYIPKECFIDRRGFDNLNELYDFIKNIKVSEYKRYLENIEAFLNGDGGRAFTAKTYAKNLVANILES